MVDHRPHRQRPPVTHLAADPVPTKRRSDSGPPGAQPEHLAPSTPRHTERAVQLGIGVGDADRRGCVAVGVVLEELSGGVGRAHEGEHEGGERWIAHGEPGEIADDLTGEESTGVAKQHEEDRAGRAELAERPGLGADNIERSVEEFGIEGVHPLIIRSAPSGCPTLPRFGRGAQRHNAAPVSTTTAAAASRAGPPILRPTIAYWP